MGDGGAVATAPGIDSGFRETAGGGAGVAFLSMLRKRGDTRQQKEMRISFDAVSQFAQGVRGAGCQTAALGEKHGCARSTNLEKGCRHIWGKTDHSIGAGVVGG
jgi:hypothetical protein